MNRTQFELLAKRVTDLEASVVTLLDVVIGDKQATMVASSNSVYVAKNLPGGWSVIGADGCAVDGMSELGESQASDAAARLNGETVAATARQVA